MARLNGFVALLFAAGIFRASGHGRMTKPAARNGNDNGAVGGGPGSVHAFGAGGKQVKYQHGICGNAAGTEQTYNMVGAVKETFTSGTYVEFRVTITAHHVGFFEFELCDDAGQLAEDCFTKHRLLKQGCQCSCPGDPSNSCDDCIECRRTWKALLDGELNQVVTEGYQGPVLAGAGNLVPYEYIMHYYIPNVKTSQAVIRWHYMTTNSCTQQTSAPEEFWNCADVKVCDSQGDCGPAKAYDNNWLKAKEVDNIIPAIDLGYLPNVNHRCPTDTHGDLKGVGLRNEYDCGTLDNGTMRWCIDLTGGSGSDSTICQGASSSDVICKEDCWDWYIQCANGIAYMKPVPPGTRCQGDRFVHESVCAGSTPAPAPTPVPPTPAPPTPTPAPPVPTPTPPAPTPMPPVPTPQPVAPTPTPAPSGSKTCGRNTDCSTNPNWCNDPAYDKYCADNGALNYCPVPHCVWNNALVQARAAEVKSHAPQEGKKRRRRLRARRPRGSEDELEESAMMQQGLTLQKPGEEGEEEWEYDDEADYEDADVQHGAEL